MIVKPRIRGFVCITSHPTGCEANVREQAAYAKGNAIDGGPKKVLVVGSSTGYGQSSRIAAAFGCGADTLGVYFERPGGDGRTGTAGWYNSLAFGKVAEESGVKAIDLNGDAFSNEIKEETMRLLREEIGPVDLFVYSLASPRRTDPTNGETYKACLKPIGGVYVNKNLNTDKAAVEEVTINPATDEDILHTQKVMGGEDWSLWIDALLEADLLAEGAKTVAYTYVGPQVTRPIYRNGTIGEAKKHLEKTSAELSAKLANRCGGTAYVSVNKAVVTQASSAIPVVPLYVSILFKLMKEAGTHEGCIEQIVRLFRDRLYADGEVLLDEEGRLRVDDWEMDPGIQQKVKEIWPRVMTENLNELTDFKGYRAEFLKLFGFGLESVDYEVEVDP
ncbi:MAG: enoyl-ACP reductase FabV [Opitutales bacterium]